MHAYETKRLTKRRKMLSVANRFVRFGAVGVIGTAVHYTVLIALVKAIGVDAIVGSSGGFIFGALVNYFLNYRYTFGSSRRHAEALPRFYLVATVGFFLNGMILGVLTKQFGFHYLLGQLVATGFVLIWNFTVNHFWTFSNDGKEQRQ